MKHYLMIIVDSESNVVDTASVVMSNNTAEPRSVEFAERNCDIERVVSCARQFMETCRSRRRAAEAKGD